VLIGTGALVYGVRWHSVAVLMEEEVVIPRFSPAGAPPYPFPGAPPSDFPPIVNLVTLEESEPRVILEVTFGGVVRLPTGDIKRTYTGPPPSLCPT